MRKNYASQTNKVKHKNNKKKITAFELVSMFIRHKNKLLSKFNTAPQLLKATEA